MLGLEFAFFFGILDCGFGKKLIYYIFCFEILGILVGLVRHYGLG